MLEVQNHLLLRVFRGEANDLVQALNEWLRDEDMLENERDGSCCALGQCRQGLFPGYLILGYSDSKIQVANAAFELLPQALGLGSRQACHHAWVHRPTQL